MLEDFKVLGDKLVASIDGAGLFSSTRISCPHGGVKKRGSGTDESYYQLLAGVIESPHQTTVLPIDFEPIIRSNGETKDCSERNVSVLTWAGHAATRPSVPNIGKFWTPYWITMAHAVPSCCRHATCAR